MRKTEIVMSGCGFAVVFRLASDESVYMACCQVLTVYFHVSKRESTGVRLNASMII